MMPPMTQPNRHPADSPRAGPVEALALENTWLSYERTLLGWIRASVSLIALGFATDRFFRVFDPEGRHAGLLSPHVFGLLMVGIGVASLAFSSAQHQAARRSLQDRYPTDAGYPALRDGYVSQFALVAALLGALAFAAMLPGS